MFIMEEFIKNFYEILDDIEIDSIDKDTDYKSLEDWDSMTKLMLIAMVHEKYEKQISGNDINQSITLEHLYSRIQSI
jgi:acyl carrier protein